jgi:sec-independent protein translocase protein TatB
VFSNIGWPEIAVLVVVALFVFGPERLPKAAADAGRMLRKLRQLLDDAKSELSDELGPELGNLDLNDLNPRRFVRKHLFEDGTDAASTAGSAASAALPLQAAVPAVQPLAPGERPPCDLDAT